MPQPSAMTFSPPVKQDSSLDPPAHAPSTDLPPSYGTQSQQSTTPYQDHKNPLILASETRAKTEVAISIDELECFSNALIGADAESIATTAAVLSHL